MTESRNVGQIAVNGKIWHAEIQVSGNNRFFSGIPTAVNGKISQKEDLTSRTLRTERVPLCPCQVQRSDKAWIENGRELKIENVQYGSTFKAPSAKLVAFWAGGPQQSDCKILSVVTYETMNGETAKRMCAALAGSRRDIPF